MYIGYARVSKADGSQKLDLQIDALIKTGVREHNIFKEYISGAKENRPQLERCLGILQKGDVLFVYKLDRLGRSNRHLLNIIEGLTDKGVGFKVLSGHGANIDTTTASGKLVLGIFAAFAEFERDLIRERVVAGLAAARARGRRGGRKHKLTPVQVRLAQNAMINKKTVVTELSQELGVTTATLYRYVGPNGELRESGKRMLQNRRKRIQ